jgi:hypothetical protein
MKKLLLILSIITITLTNCTENQRARNFGGKEKLSLPTNHVLITCCWKQDDLWLLTKDTITNTYYCREKSSWGIWNGEIIIK